MSSEVVDLVSISCWQEKSNRRTGRAAGKNNHYKSVIQLWQFRVLVILILTSGCGCASSYEITTTDPTTVELTRT